MRGQVHRWSRFLGNIYKYLRKVLQQFTAIAGRLRRLPFACSIV